MTDDERQERRRYGIGAGLSAVLTAVAFWAVLGGAVSPATGLTVLGLAAILQIGVQLRCFLHLDWTSQKREDLQLILFSLMLLGIMVGGTIWIMGSLASRMH